MRCSNLRFLVVEDHAFQRRVAVQLLQGLGAQAVHAAQDGREALQVLADPHRPVDIVISDLSMPGMDGMEFIRRLSASGKPVSLILASAFDASLLSSVANMAQAYGVRLLGAMAKPVTGDNLTPMLALHRSLQSSQPAAQAAFSLEELIEAWLRDEIAPWFAPRMDLEDGRIVAMHAVPRWRHATRGWLDAPAFMPSVRARGLQDDIAWMLLRKCMIHCREWQEAAPGLVVYAPLAFTSLVDVRMALRMRQVAENAGVEPRQLVFGVPDQALNARDPRLLENLARLRMDGFGLAIDSFGNAAMDLEQMALVSFTELKVDAVLVGKVTGDSNARAGVAVALEMAQQLRLTAVADGLATTEACRLLREWGCHQAVGPHVGGPLPAADVPAWLARRGTSAPGGPLQEAGHD